MRGYCQCRLASYGQGSVIGLPAHSEQPLLSYLPNHDVQAKARLLVARSFATKNTINVVGRLANA
jgi:hypothetical protein